MTLPTNIRLLTEGVADTSYAPRVASQQAQRVSTLPDFIAPMSASTPPPFAALSTTTPKDVIVDPSQTYQEVLGLGAALTDAAAYNLINHLTPAQRKTLLTELYGPGQCNWSTVRISLGASDFQAGPLFTYDDMPAGQTDPNLTQFSAVNDTARVIPLLKQIFAINPKTRVFASVWYAPTWMQTAGVIASGYYATYANYLVKAIQAYQSYGIPIYALSVRNEAYDNGYSTAVQQQLIQAVGAAFTAAGITTRLMVHDSQWSELVNPTAVLADTTTLSCVTDIAWHGYAGVPTVMTTARNLWPRLGQHMTEHRSLLSESTALAFKFMAGGTIALSLRNWAQSVTLWNLALDEVGNPNGGTTGRRGVITIASDGSGVTRNPEYYALTHASKFLQSGARRCHSSNFGVPYSLSATVPNVYPDDVKTAAFINPDGSIVLYAFNGASTAQTFQIIDARSGQGFPVTMAASELATFVWGTSRQALPTGSTSGWTAPTAPTLTATGGAGEATLSWTAPTGGAPVSTYTVTRAGVIVAQLPATTTAYTDFCGAGTYGYAVTADSVAGPTPSNTITITATAPAAPGAPVLSLDATLGLLLSWTPAATNGSKVASYSLQRSTSSGTETTIATLPQGTTSYYDIGAATGVRYYYKLVGNNTAGAGTASNEVNGTSNVQRVVTDSTATGNAAGAQINTLSWTHNVGTLSHGLIIVTVNSGAGSNLTDPLMASVSCGGQALTRLAYADAEPGGSIVNRTAEIWYGLAPAAGAQTITATYPTGKAAQFVAGSFTFDGVNQTTPFGTPVTAAGQAASETVTVATAPGDIVITTGTFRHSGITLGAGQVSQYSLLSGTNTYGATTTQSSTSSSVTQSMGSSASDDIALVSVSIHGG